MTGGPTHAYSGVARVPRGALHAPWLIPPLVLAALALLALVPRVQARYPAALVEGGEVGRDAKVATGR